MMTAWCGAKSSLGVAQPPGDDAYSAATAARQAPAPSMAAGASGDAGVARRGAALK